jgi:hypothetical protein
MKAKAAAGIASLPWTLAHVSAQKGDVAKAVINSAAHTGDRLTLSMP